MQATAPDAEQSLAERYGAISRRRRLRWGGAALVLVVVGSLAWLVWAALAQQSPGYGAALRSYDVVTKHRVRVVLAVHRATGKGLVCTVTALAVDHAVVGEREVGIEAGPEQDLTVPVVVKTDRRATTATVTGCR
jgi:Domain of unknown function (DUF4307)